ncbi:MAG: hypothetical protein ABI175_22085, partial [Polyangiales bacterium]
MSGAGQLVEITRRRAGHVRCSAGPVMRLHSLFAAFLATASVLPIVGCALDEDDSGEELGDIGDGKSDSFGI